MLQQHPDSRSMARAVRCRFDTRECDSRAEAEAAQARRGGGVIGQVLDSRTRRRFYVVAPNEEIVRRWQARKIQRIRARRLRLA